MCDKPVCRYCDWLTLESIILAGKKLEEFVCQRHLIGSPKLSRCDLFLRAIGSDDE
jgi:hypothetical protein